MKVRKVFNVEMIQICFLCFMRLNNPMTNITSVISRHLVFSLPNRDWVWYSNDRALISRSWEIGCVIDNLKASQSIIFHFITQSCLWAPFNSSSKFNSELNLFIVPLPKLKGVKQISYPITVINISQLTSCCQSPYPIGSSLIL